MSNKEFAWYLIIGLLFVFAGSVFLYYHYYRFWGKGRDEININGYQVKGAVIRSITAPVVSGAPLDIPRLDALIPRTTTHTDLQPISPTTLKTIIAPRPQ